MRSFWTSEGSATRNAPDGGYGIEEFVAAIRGAKLTIYQATGHWPNWERLGTPCAGCGRPPDVSASVTGGFFRAARAIPLPSS